MIHYNMAKLNPVTRNEGYVKTNDIKRYIEDDKYFNRNEKSTLCLQISSLQGKT